MSGSLSVYAMKKFLPPFFCLTEVNFFFLLSLCNHLTCILFSLTILYFWLELSLPLPCLIRLSNPDSRFTVCDENVLHDDPSEVDSPSHWSLSPLLVEDILSDAVGLDRLNSSHTVFLIITSIALQYTIWLSNVYHFSFYYSFMKNETV